MEMDMFLTFQRLVLKADPDWCMPAKKGHAPTPGWVCLRLF